MTDDHAHLHADLAAYALGALDGSEQAAIEAHLRACAACSRVLAEYRQAAELLPLALPLVEPPHGVKTAIMERVRTQATQTPAPARIDRPADGAPRAISPPAGMRPSRGRIHLWLRPLSWAAAAAVIAGLLAWNVSLRRDQDPNLRAIAGTPDERVAPMVNTAAAPGAGGRLFLAEDGQKAVLVVHGLPRPAPGHTYQFWFATRDKSRRDSAGVFEVDAKGQAIVSLTIPGLLSQYAEIWITQEPSGGSTVPTAPHFLEGPLT